MWVVERASARRHAQKQLNVAFSLCPIPKVKLLRTLPNWEAFFDPFRFTQRGIFPHFLANAIDALQQKPKKPKNFQKQSQSRLRSE
tara:strand:+ start:426 stop:683 length:258 start_codon:yes stop_codon:yes gene_type:complete